MQAIMLRKLKKAVQECRNKDVATTIQYIVSVTKLSKCDVVKYLQEREHYAKKHNNRH